MFWHIFKKDWKLLWQFALAIAVVQVAAVTASFNLGHFGGDRLLSSFLVLLEMALYFGEACLIAAIVHQDAIPGLRQDWLVRPIKRRDLFLAKLLFVLAAVQLPLLLADFMEGLAFGFSIQQSLSAAASQNLFMLAAFTLPVLAFVSLTKSVAEATFGAFVGFVCVVAFELLNAGLQGGSALGPTMNSGIDWIPDAGRYVLYVLGAAFILYLQYFRRKILVSRWTLCGVALLCLFTEVVPWRSAYALQERLSPKSAVSHSLEIRFEPSLGRFRSPLPFDLQANMRNVALRSPDSGLGLYVPLSVFGMPSDSVLKCDRAVARVIGGNARAETLTMANDLNDEFEVHNDGKGKAERLVHEPLHIRGDLYGRLRNEPVRLEIDYSLTLMKLSSAHAIPAVNGEQRTADAGWCETRLNENETAVEVRCLHAGRVPSQCASAFLENPVSGRRNPDRFGCADDYQPYFGRYKPVDAISRLGTNLPFYDPSGLTKYPVDGGELAQSVIVIRSYAAEDHFTRRLVIPNIRLSDWISH